jgi:ABC-2 type transport system permease protein
MSTPRVRVAALAVQPPPSAWFGALAAMTRKELLIILRYPLELVASFGQVFLIVAIFTLAGLMFAPTDQAAPEARAGVAGTMIYGFILFIFLTETLWTIGYHVRREQKQGTFEQLYLSPAPRSASLISRVLVTLLWTGLLAAISVAIMSAMIGHLPFANLGLSVPILLLALSGTFGVGFAFAGLTLHVRETAQVLASVLQFSFMVLCAPFFPFAALPDWLQLVSRAIPLSYGVDAFRASLMGFPPGFPELAPIDTELAIVATFGVLMPALGLWIYRRAEERARRSGTLSEY